MRKILLGIAVFIVLWIVVVHASVTCSSSKTSVGDAIDSVDSMVTETAAFDVAHYYGDTLTSVNGITYYLAYGTGDDSDVASIDETVIIAMRDTVPIDTCHIKGEYNLLRAYDSTLEIVSGIDTLRYDITKLPKVLDDIGPVILDGAKETKYEHAFAESVHCQGCEVMTQFYVLPNEGQRLFDCLIDIIQCDINYIMDGKTPGRTKKYQGNKRDLYAMGRFYANEFERIYFEDLGKPVDDDDFYGCKYDYLFRVMPVWESCDKSLVTYKFYNYQYMGGAHGGMCEYFFTFDRSNGKLLGANDLLSIKEFTDVIQKLEKQINKYKEDNGYPDRNRTANLDGVPVETPEYGQKYSLRESVVGRTFPRPALTKHGVVFSYQPYEMGSFSEGILHFVVPYGVIPGLKFPTNGIRCEETIEVIKSDIK